MKGYSAINNLCGSSANSSGAGVIDVFLVFCLNVAFILQLNNLSLILLGYFQTNGLLIKD